MCLAVPAQIKSINGEEAEVDFGGIIRKINLVFTPEARVGDYVIVHAGFSISILSMDEALETLKMFNSIGEDEIS